MLAVELPVTDERRVIAELFQKLRFPRDLDVFMILPLPVIKRYLYSLDPKDALIVTGSPDFRRLLDYKMSENWFERVVHWMARRINGFRI